MDSIICPVYEAASMSRNRVALDAGGEGVLFYHLEERVRAAAAAILGAGLMGGDALGLYMPTCWEFWVLMLACWRTGVIACPLDTALPEDSLRKCSCEMGLSAIAAPGVTGQTASGLRLLDSRVLATAQAIGHTGDTPRLSLQCPAVRFAAVGADIAVYQHSIAALYYGARGANTTQRIHSDDRWMVLAPVHTPEFTMTALRAMLAGATLVLCGQADDVAEHIAEREITMLSLSGTQLEFLMEHLTSKDCPGLRALMIEGGDLGEETARRVATMKWPLWECCGWAQTLGSAGLRPRYIDPPPQFTWFHGLQVSLPSNNTALLRGHVLADGQVHDGCCEPLHTNRDGECLLPLRCT